MIINSSNTNKKNSSFKMIHSENRIKIIRLDSNKSQNYDEMEILVRKLIIWTE